MNEIFTCPNDIIGNIASFLSVKTVIHRLLPIHKSTYLFAVNLLSGREQELAALLDLENRKGRYGINHYLGNFTGTLFNSKICTSITSLYPPPKKIERVFFAYASIQFTQIQFLSLRESKCHFIDIDIICTQWANDPPKDPIRPLRFQ